MWLQKYLVPLRIRLLNVLSELVEVACSFAKLFEGFLNLGVEYVTAFSSALPTV